MVKKVEMLGKKFNRLSVISQAESVRRPNGSLAIHWNCICDCGNEVVVSGTNLRSNHTKSCGCFAKEVLKSIFTKHGMRGTPTHNTWYGMVSRCTNPNDITYYKYGEVGITVCERWLGEEGLFNFIEDMGIRPENTSLDRIDTRLGYFPENCRWADRTIQAFNQDIQSNNTSGRTGVTWHEKDQVWIAQIGVDYKCIRLGRYTSFEDAVKAREEAELKYFGFVKPY